MPEFNFDNIDLFYYHSTDFDITRIYSILKYGILSSNQIKEKNISYYHRNYINASCKEDYVSVSHFPRTFWQYYRLQNELYDNSSNKITFVLNGRINAEDKKFYNNKYKYTNERHVKDGILLNDIIGILIREVDCNKSIDKILVFKEHSDFEGLIKRYFDIIDFFKEVHNYKINIDSLYCLSGKLIKAKVYNEDYKVILEEINEFMKRAIESAYKNILNIDNPTLKNILMLYSNNIPIYVMTKYDIKPIDKENELINSEKEKFEQSYPKRKYIYVSDEEYKKKKKNTQILIKHAVLEDQMRTSDQNIYLDGYQGPLTLDGNKIMQKILNDN